MYSTASAPSARRGGRGHHPAGGAGGSLRAGGVRFVPPADERAEIVLLTRHGPVNPALTPLRAAVLEALDRSLAGFEPA